MNRMCAKNNTHTYMWCEQAIIEWLRHVISIVACCHTVKLWTHAAQAFRLQHKIRWLFILWSNYTNRKWNPWIAWSWWSYSNHMLKAIMSTYSTKYVNTSINFLRTLRGVWQVRLKQDLLIVNARANLPVKQNNYYTLSKVIQGNAMVKVLPKLFVWHSSRTLLEWNGDTTKSPLHSDDVPWRVSDEKLWDESLTSCHLQVLYHQTSLKYSIYWMRNI